MKAETKLKLQRFVGCRVFWTSVFLTGAYVLLAYSLPTQAFLELVRIMAATTSLIVAVSYSVDAWESVTAEQPDRTDSLVIGIFLMAVSGFVTNFWLLMYRLAERQEWMLNLLTFGFLSAWLAAFAAVLQVWAPGVLRKSADGEDVPPARLRAVGLAASIGVFAALVVLASQPNIIWVVEGLRPWLR